jgi:hydrogenase nickel incorporation protein HypA/HybF
MHEATMADSILRMASEVARREKIRNVKRVDVIIGELHHVVAGVLRTHYEIGKADFPALSRSKLRIRTRKARIACRHCRKKSALTAVSFLCPSCGSAQIEVIGGMELHLASIEGETDTEKTRKGEKPQARR